MISAQIPDSAWIDILQGKENYEFESLSLKILLAKLRLKSKIKPEDEIYYLNELKLLVRVQNSLPGMQRDTNKIISRISNETNKVLFTVEETSQLIESNKKLLIAGDELLLKQLPKGNWIAGTIPYFIGTNGGIKSKNLLHVTILPEFVEDFTIVEYDTESINQVYNETPKNGFTVLIIPASSPIHYSFALNTLNYDKFATSPVIGWISGVSLEDIGTQTAKVAFGDSLKLSSNTAVAVHIQLPEKYYAEISIINIFEQGNGDTITFSEDGFSFTNCFINGTKENFAEYLKKNNIDTRLPLVAEFDGLSINTSFQKIDLEQNIVELYAPVFKGTSYKIAKPLNNYETALNEHIKSIKTNTIVFSCNCILNYLYGELEGKKTDSITGPITFGEIAYQLLNQTLAYLKIEKHI